MSKKNILFISTWFPNRVDKLNGIFVKRHADCASRVANLIILAVQPDKKLPYHKIEITENQPGDYKTIIVYYGDTRLGTIGKYFQIITAYFKGISHIHRTKFDYDIIHANVTIHAGIIAKLLSKWKRKPYIITEHSSAYALENANKERSFFYTLAIWACKGAQYLLPVSQSLMKGMEKHKIKGEYQILSNVVNTKIFNYPIQNKKNSPFTFLHISGLDSNIKNPEGIIDAIKILSNFNRHFKMTIAGNDASRYRLKEYASAIGVTSDIIEYKGYLSEREVARWMQNSHCFVLYSNFETQGCVLLESLCCGTPVIGTNVGGIPEIITDRCGILVSPNQPHELATAMNQMILKYKKYNSKQISKHAISHYSIEQIARKMQAIYASI